MSGVTADSEKPPGTCHMWCRPRAGTSIALCRFCVKSSKGPNIIGSDANIGTYTVYVAEDYPPSFTSKDRVDVPENTTSVIAVTAQDYDVDDDVTVYAIVGGDDRDSFTIINTGVLAFAAAPDYERPTDQNGDNVYDVEVEATSGSRNAATRHAIKVTVLNMDEFNIVPSGAIDLGNITAESRNRGRQDSIDSATHDVDHFRFRITAGRRVDIRLELLDAGASLFIEDTAGNVLARDETPGPTDKTVSISLHPGTYYIRVQTQEEGPNNYQLVYKVDFPNFGRPPVFFSASHAEVMENTTNVLTVEAKDPDPTDRVTAYAIARGDDGDAFTITSPQGRLKFKVAPDYENPGDEDGNNVHHLIVEATSGSDNIKGTRPIDLTVVDYADPDATRNTAIDLGNITLLNEPRFPVGSMQGDDDTVDYYRFTLDEPRSLVLGLRQLDFDADLHLEGEDGTLLDSSENTGLINETIIFHLYPGVYFIRAVAQQPFTNDYVLRYGVTNLEHVKFYTFENSTAVGTVEVPAANADDTNVEYSVIGGPDSGRFDLDSASGELSFKSTPDFDNPSDVNSDAVFQVVIVAAVETRGVTTDHHRAVSVQVLDLSNHGMLSTRAVSDHGCAVTEEPGGRLLGSGPGRRDSEPVYDL